MKPPFNNEKNLGMTGAGLENNNLEIWNRTLYQPVDAGSDY